MNSNTQISLKSSLIDFEKGMLDFLWKEWSALGVFGATEPEKDWCIDPEVLLLLTTEIGRHDARLFDEVLDWLKANSRWINTQRLRSLQTKHGIGDLRVLSAVARAMMDCGPETKWRKIAEQPVEKEPTEALFRTGYRQIKGADDPYDPIFEQYGLIRAMRHERPLALPVAMLEPVALLFRLRALFGLGMRADIACYLLAQGECHASMLAEVLGYSQRRVQETLLEMYGSGLLKIRSSGRKRVYSLDRQAWTEFLRPLGSTFPLWIDWCPLARGLLAVWRGIWKKDLLKLDPYVVSSHVRTVMLQAHDDLQGCGVNFVLEDDRAYIGEDYLTAFIRNLGHLTNALAEDRARVR